MRNDFVYLRERDGKGHQHLHLFPRVFAFVRMSPDGESRVLCLANVANEEVALSHPAGLDGEVRDLVTGRALQASAFALKPYEVLWLKGA